MFFVFSYSFFSLFVLANFPCFSAEDIKHCAFATVIYAKRGGAGFQLDCETKKRLQQITALSSEKVKNFEGYIPSYILFTSQHASQDVELDHVRKVAHQVGGVGLAQVQFGTLSKLLQMAGKSKIEKFPELEIEKSLLCKMLQLFSDCIGTKKAIQFIPVEDRHVALLVDGVIRAGGRIQLWRMGMLLRQKEMNTQLLDKDGDWVHIEGPVHNAYKRYYSGLN